MNRNCMVLIGALACAPSASVSADEGHNRRAELIDLRVANVMQMDFGGMVDASELRPEFVLRERARSMSSTLPTDRIRIPLWMQPSSSVAFAGVNTGHNVRFGSCTPRRYLPSSILKSGAEQRRRLLYPLVQRAACEAGIPVALMDALLMQESRYNPIATSPKGAFGLGQLMPATAKQLGVDRYDLQENLQGAARYLSWQLREFGRVDLALAAYNAGPGRVRAAKGVPRIAETINYVRIVLANWGAIESNHASLPPRLLSQQPLRSIWHGDFRSTSASALGYD